MQKIIVLILTLLTVSKTVLSQDLNLKCGGKEIECQNGNLGHFEMIIHSPHIETDTTQLPQGIRNLAKQYLIDRIGSTFYGKLNYYSCQIVDYNKFKEIKKQKPYISKNGDKRIKYGIQYYFVVQDSMRYYLSLVFDKNGKIISQDQLPSFKSNKQFDKILNVCETKIIAEQDTIFTGELKNIYLEYSDSANAFVWRVEKPSVRGTKPRENIRRFILINANNGQVVKREDESWTSACSGNSF